MVSYRRTLRKFSPHQPRSHNIAVTLCRANAAATAAQPHTTTSPFASSSPRMAIFCTAAKIMQFANWSNKIKEQRGSVLSMLNAGSCLCQAAHRVVVIFRQPDRVAVSVCFCVLELVVGKCNEQILRSVNECDRVVCLLFSQKEWVFHGVAEEKREKRAVTERRKRA